MPLQTFFSDKSTESVIAKKYLNVSKQNKTNWKIEAKWTIEVVTKT